MAKIQAQIQLQVSFLKEGDHFVAYSPALDLSTSGNTYEKAKKRFGEAANVFLEELCRAGTLGLTLKELGWRQKTEKRWDPPIIVSQETQAVEIPIQ